MGQNTPDYGAAVKAILTPSGICTLLIIFALVQYSRTGESGYLILLGVCVVVFIAIQLLGGGFAIWQQRANEGVAVQIQKVFDAFTGPFRTRGVPAAYANALRVMHSLFDVKGLSTQGVYSLELEQVFVKLNIAPGQVGQNNPVDVPAGLQRGNYEIWSFIDAPPLKHLAVIGVPGCGKTTLLKFMTLALAHRSKHTDAIIPNKLPILLFIRDHAEAITSDPNTKLSDLVPKSLSLMKEPVPAAWFEKQLEAGRCLVMLDGLDEVGNPQLRRKVAAWVERQTKTHHNNIFIVSSRPNGYTSNPIEGMTLLHVQTFNQPQIEMFVENWYTATEVMSQQKPSSDERVQFEAKAGATDLLKRIKDNRDLAELAINPLLLTMIANVHRWRSALPGRRVELYAEMCEVFLGKRRQAAGVEDVLTPAQKQSVLQVLAYEMMEQNKREISLLEAAKIIAAPLKLLPQKMTAEDFLHLIRDGSGILIEREAQIYAFSHKTFQEFMASVHITEKRLLQQLLKQVGQHWWHETIRLYCAKNDATPIVSECLSKMPPSLERLVLAIECAEEALQLDDAIREKLTNLIEEGLDSEDVERFEIAAQAKLALRLAHLSRLDDARYADSNLITHAEYQLFLDEYPHYVPDYWKGDRFINGTARKAVIGVSPTAAEAFCKWLTEREIGVGWIYRLPRKGELEGGTYWVESKEGYSLAGIGKYRQMSFAEWAEEDTPAANLLKELFGETITVWDLRFSISAAFECLFFQLTLDSARDLAFDHDSVLALDLARPLAFDLARALDSARDLASGLARISGLDSALTSKLVRASASDLSRASSRALDRAFESVLVSPRTSASARELVNALDSAHKSELTSALNKVRSLAHELDRELASARASARARELDRSYHNIDYETGLYRVIALLKNVIHCLLLWLEWINQRKHYLPSLGPFRHRDLKLFRTSLLERISIHYGKRPSQPRDQEPWRTELDWLMQTYAQFVTLEKRRRGEWEAYEGIRIVREKVQD